MKNRAAAAFWLIPFAFLLSAPGVPMAQEGQDGEQGAGERWYKGNLHMHTFWSDGYVFPEEAIDWYKDRGYHFVSTTDHYLFQQVKDNWLTAGQTERPAELGHAPRKLTENHINRYLGRYGGDWAEIAAAEDGTRRVRLKTFDEFSAKMNVPGEFLVIPGQEVQNPGGGWIHGNAIGIGASMTYLSGKTNAETLRLNAAALARHAAETGRETIYILNHPTAWYFDFYPRDLIDAAEVLFHEILTAPRPAGKPHPSFWTHEKFWDIVNAFRIEDGLRPLYGVAGDDRHAYPASPTTPCKFIMVRAPELTTENLLRSMREGDFYASNGVILEKIDFDPAARALSVKVKAEPGVKYAIRFNGTKRGFDRSHATVDDPAADRKPKRAIPVYSDEIGKVFAQTEGTEASYRMADDDLYVRATVDSDKEWISGRATEAAYLPARESAWSQPYGFAPKDR